MQPKVVDLSSTSFNAIQASELLKPGTNTIKGGAFMRQIGGGVVTCAGETVNLIPVTSYATARMKAIYDTDGSDGFTGINQTRMMTFTPDVEGYQFLTRKTRCDAQGNFVFDKVATGSFFVTTTVRWSVGNSGQGSVLMQRATVTNDESINLIIAPPR